MNDIYVRYEIRFPYNQGITYSKTDIEHLIRNWRSLSILVMYLIESHF